MNLKCVLFLNWFGIQAALRLHGARRVLVCMLSGIPTRVRYWNLRMVCACLVCFCLSVAGSAEALVGFVPTRGRGSTSGPCHTRGLGALLLAATELGGSCHPVRGELNTPFRHACYAVVFELLGDLPHVRGEAR